MQTELEKKISKGRWRIIQRDFFFATILMDMDPTLDASVTETCATDGERLFFNPDWLAQAHDRSVAASLNKMALHVALSHHLRRGPTRDPQRWRAATDQAALHLMQASGVDLPEGAEALPQFAGMTADEIYRLLTEQQGQQDQQQGQQQPQGGAGGDQGQDQPGDGQGQPSGPQGGADGKPGADGGVGQALDGADMRDAPQVSQKQAQNDQRIFNAQMAAKAQGQQSAFAEELIGQIKARGVDWRDRLQQFINDRAETRFAWTRPNRRFIGADIYLPGRVADGVDRLAFIIDTSLSMSQPELEMCVAQIEAAREAIGIAQVVVIQIDTKVKAVDIFEAADPLPTEMNLKGRGGTNMQPAFDEATRHDPTAAIMLTDGEFKDLTVDPGFPVLFALTHKGRQGRAPATFGTFVDLPAPEAA